jgi:transcriptional regulator with XRE-family HTH domain
LRKKAGLTLAQLAELADVDSGFLGYIELGQKTPSLETVERIAKGLQAPMAHLFDSNTIAEKKSDEDEQILEQVRYLLQSRGNAEKSDLLAILKQLRDPERAKALRKIIRA